MKTILLNKTKKWLPVLLLAVSIFSINAVKACTVSIGTTYGLNGHVTFKASTTGSTQYGNTFLWNAGDGSGNTYSYDSAFSHIYTANGTYKVAVKLTVDTLGCTSYDTVSINVTNVTIPCDLSANFTYTVNAGGAVTFTSTSTGTYAGTQYYWNPGDGSNTVLGSSTFNYTYTYQGTYGVWLYIKDTGSAYCTDSIYTYILVNTADSNECHLRAKFTYNMGSNGHVTFNNTSSCLYTSDLSANWSFGDGGNASTTSISYTHVYTANGTYTVNLTAGDGDSSSCMDTTTHVITVTNVTTPCLLSAAFNVVNDTTTGQVQLISISTGINAGTEYFWKPTSSSTPVKAGSSYTTTYPANGTYTAWLIIKDTGSAFCIDSIMETVNVSNVDSLHASFINTYSSDTSGYYDYFFTSTSTGINDITMYAWEPGDTTAGDTGVNMTTYSHAYLYPGLHTVTLSLWFSKYPIIGHNTGGGNDKHAIFYQLSTYSMVIDIKPAGIANVVEGTSSDMKLYPNPNKGLFRLDIDDVGNNTNATLQVTNLLGEVVYQTTASASNGAIVKDIDLSNVSNGTYFVRIITPDKVYNTKAVINR